MDSRESLAQPPSLQQRHQTHHQQQRQLPPAMMMAPNPFNTHHHHLPNNSNNPPPANNNSIISSDSLQQRFAFDGPDQYGDGSSPPGGFRAGGFSIEPARKKRGRPRKYSPSPDGNIALALAPAPVSTGGGSAASGGGHLESSNDGGATGTPTTDPSAKKHRGRPPGSGKKQLDALGAPGVGFTPHVITVKAGEDIASKITAFSQQGPRTVCILSANGAISNVTLRQPAMSGGSVTYEGRFEIISLSGSFLLADNNGNNQSNRSSGLSVSLAGSDGRVLGGGVAGSLIAATPVQVVVGSFITDTKKPKSSGGPAAAPPPNMLNFGSGPGSVPGASPPSDGPTSESSEESGGGGGGGGGGGSPLRRPTPGSYNNPSQQPPPPMPMYSNMGWPNSTMNMLRN